MEGLSPTEGALFVLAASTTNPVTPDRMGADRAAIYIGDGNRVHTIVGVGDASGPPQQSILPYQAVFIARRGIFNLEDIRVGDVTQTSRPMRAPGVGDPDAPPPTIPIPPMGTQVPYPMPKP
jgi:hypothetical protein